MWRLIALGVLFCQVTIASRMSRVIVRDNGYENVVVAISPMLREDKAQNIIQAIKVSMTEASEVLFTATKQKLYFKDVKILVPKSWTNTNIDAIATTERFEESELRIDLVNSVYNTQPYTVQPGGCGDPGLYIHLTPDYLLDDEQAKWWGPRGKVLAKEWAHLRWGVFEEIGYPDDLNLPLFYLEQEIVNNTVKKVLKPNTCTDKIPLGSWRDISTGGECHFAGEIPGRDCRFVPKTGQNIITSLMAYQYMDNVKEFCNNISLHAHNDIAPNRQNLLCNGLSVWEVMEAHSDFQDLSEASHNMTVIPRFTVVREEVASFVIVLDYSQSMTTANRIFRLQKSAQRWILHEVAQGSFVGIVGFSGTGFIMERLLEITNDNSRQHLAASIVNETLSTGICIGCGLRKAVTEVLNGRHNKVIILISDGEENIPPYIDDVMNEVVSSGTRVVSIAYGDKAAQKLEELAQNTGGKSYIVYDNDDGTMADDAFDGALTYQPGDSLSNVTVEIYEYSYQGPNKFANGNFTVDATLGRNLTYHLDTNFASHITTPPVLVSPNGTVYNTSSQDSTVNLWTIHVDFAKVSKGMHSG
ncbi:hypothetical protein SK128_014953 [Halocaridina rubra]|uniref:VWFA domain-containing protein n=1 Tax=Halocaridina rubra TaxID=373956 RepID=A0AAN8WTS0_HALRR